VKQAISDPYCRTPCLWLSVRSMHEPIETLVVSGS